MKTATIILLFVGIALFVAYTCYAVKKAGMPKSLSQTYYLMKAYKQGWMFQFTLVLLGFFLLPAWINLSPDWWMFLGFISCGSIIFVGAAARYLRMEEKHIHTACAWIAAASSVLWSILSYDWLWISPVVFAIAGGIFALIYRKSYYFWLEMAAFANAFVSLIVAIFIQTW